MGNRDNNLLNMYFEVYIILNVLCALVIGRLTLLCGLLIGRMLGRAQETLFFFVPS